MTVAPSIWRFRWFCSLTLGFWVHPKLEGKSLNSGKTSLRICSLCWGDPCVQVSSVLVSRSSRIKFGKKWANFGQERVKNSSSGRVQRSYRGPGRSDHYSPIFGPNSLYARAVGLPDFWSDRWTSVSRPLFIVSSAVCSPLVRLTSFLLRWIHNFIRNILPPVGKCVHLILELRLLGFEFGTYFDRFLRRILFGSCSPPPPVAPSVLQWASSSPFYSAFLATGSW